MHATYRSSWRRVDGLQSSVILNLVYMILNLVRHRCRDNHLRLSLARGAALQYELGLVLQHQYSLGPIVPLNCVRPSAVRGVWVYQTSDMRGLFHLRDVDGIDTWMLPPYHE